MSFRIAPADWCGWAWSHKSQYEPHHCGCTAGSNSIDVCWREKENYDKNKSWCFVSHKHKKPKYNHSTRKETTYQCELPVCVQHLSARACLKRMSSGRRRIRDAVWGMGNRESNGRNFSNLAPYWFLLLFLPVLSQSHGKKTTNIQDVECVLTWAEGKRQWGREEVVKQADVSIKIIYRVNCLKKKRFSHRPVPRWKKVEPVQASVSAVLC